MPRQVRWQRHRRIRHLRLSLQVLLLRSHRLVRLLLRLRRLVRWQKHRRQHRLILLRPAMRSPPRNATAAPTPSAPAAPARTASDEDYVSEDDEKVENSTFIGLRAIEKIIGGTVIDERPLHQP